MLFNEPKLLKYGAGRTGSNRQRGFSALQRAEIAEMPILYHTPRRLSSFSALQRAEIAEMYFRGGEPLPILVFQCSSTSRNC